MPATIQSLHVYPVKGLKGIDVARSRCETKTLSSSTTMNLRSCSRPRSVARVSAKSMPLRPFTG